MANQVVYGFHHLADVFGQRVTEIGVDVVNDAIDQAIAEHRRQMAAFTSLFVRTTTQFKTVFRTVAITRNQPLDEFGRPIPVKAPGKYEVGLPIYDSGSAFGFDWQAGVKMTVEEVNNTVLAIEIGDMRWVFDHILAALFNNANLTFVDPEHGSLTVLPIANGDSQVYNVFSGSDVGATDNHLLAQANTIGAAGDNPFPGIYTELTEHPENGQGAVLTFIPTGLRSATEALASFFPVADANIRPGTSTDQLVGSPGVGAPGTLIGYVDGNWVYEWPRIPANYSVSIHTGGPEPLAERVDTAPELQGFVELPRNEDMPWYQRSWLRKAGYGAWNRVGAVVKRYGNASYAIPTNFSSPMP